MTLVRYQIQPGDSVSVIAANHNTTSEIVRNANDLDDNSIRVNDYLLIPASIHNEDSYTLSAANRLAKIKSTSRGRYKLGHVVSEGDSLWSIASEHELSYEDLARWNGMAPRDQLDVGEELVIWKDSRDGAIIRTVYYKVRNGDTISDIAGRFNVAINDIGKWNDLNLQEILKLGQKLKLYVDVTRVSA